MSMVDSHLCGVQRQSGDAGLCGLVQREAASQCVGAQLVCCSGALRDKTLAAA
jgi:hypothetical protein